MFRFAFHGHGTRNGAVRLDQFVGREGRTAHFALVAVGAVVAAFGAGSHDVTVGKEGPSLLVVILHRRFFDEFAFVVEFAEEFGSRFRMNRRRSSRIDVERNAQPFERILDQFVVTIDDLLRRNALLTGFDGDGHAVFVASADPDDVAPPQTQIPHIDVRRHVHARQMADMHRTVGVGKGRRNQITLELFCHIFSCALLQIIISVKISNFYDKQKVKAHISQNI